MKDTLIRTLHCAGRTMRIYQCGERNGAPLFRRTIKGKGWNLATLTSECNAWVIFQNGKQELRAAHPRAQMYENHIIAQVAPETVRLFNEARHAALVALETYAIPYTLRPANTAGVKITFESVEFFAEIETFKAHLRPLGFIGTY